MKSNLPSRTSDRTLITGITGMVGSHMADYLLDKTAVYGIKRWRSPMDNISHLDGKIKLVNADLNDLASIINALNIIQPDTIYHFAAQSYVLDSYTMPAQTMQTNAIGTLNLLEACRLTGLNTFIAICSSSEVYGQVQPEDVPIKETCPFRPMSPYAVSKVAEDMLGRQYYKAYDMDIIRTRLFTHTGPRRGNVFAESLFAWQIARCEKGLQDAVYNHGSEESLKSVRTWLDVRDAVKAYWKLRECPSGEIYNIGGDKTKTIGEMLDSLRRLSTHPLPVVTDGAWLRPADVTLQIPDTSKFRNQTGWKPEILFETTMFDLLNYWRERV